MERERSFNPEAEPRLPYKAGDIREINGKKYKAIDSGYTLRQYYAHSTLEKGPGPGWDFRSGLLDDDFALKEYGQTFTEEQVYGHEPLPDIPYVNWELVEEE